MTHYRRRLVAHQRRHSELVRGQSALFLTALEDDIEIFEPAQTLLVSDDSPKYNATMLYFESQYMRTVIK